jgi:hypothetical protein
MKVLGVLSLTGLAFFFVLLGASLFPKGAFVSSYAYAYDALYSESEEPYEALYYLAEGPAGSLWEGDHGAEDLSRVLLQNVQATDLITMRKTVTELVNRLRASEKIPALSLDDALSKAAQIRAEELMESFSHTRPDGSQFQTILTQMGIKFGGAAENISMGTEHGPVEVVNSWSNSKGHRKNMLNKAYKKIGVGCYVKGKSYYWVQLFY